MPSEAFLQVVQTLISRINMGNSPGDDCWVDLETQSPSTKLLVRIYSILSEGCALEESNTQSAYVATLKSYFKVNLPVHFS